MERISDLKLRIANLENDNVILAREHDLTRENALQSIAEARNVEALRNDLEQMQAEELDNNKYIGKLVQENEWMQARIDAIDHDRV